MRRCSWTTASGQYLPVLRPFRLELVTAFELGGGHRAFRPVVCHLCDIQAPSNVALNVIISASDANSLTVIVSRHIGPRPWQLFTQELAFLLALRVLKVLLSLQIQSTHDFSIPFFVLLKGLFYLQSDPAVQLRCGVCCWG